MQHNVFTYNLASLYYERGDYRQALQLLHEVEFTDAFYHVAAKLIQLKSYFELDETDAFFALVEAARKYLQRNRQLSEYQKKSNASFLRFATRIYNLRIQRGALTRGEFAQAHRRLSDRLAAAEPLANKEWLQAALAGIAE